jgi:hypothetical protein
MEQGKQRTIEFVILLAIQTVIELSLEYLFPELGVSILRAGITGSIACIGLLIYGMVSNSYNFPLMGTLSLLASSYAGSYIVEQGYVNIITASSTFIFVIVQVLVLLVTHLLLRDLYDKIPQKRGR